MWDLPSSTMLPTCTTISPIPSAAAVRCRYCTVTRAAGSAPGNDPKAPQAVAIDRLSSAESPAPRAVNQRSLAFTSRELRPAGG